MNKTILIIDDDEDDLLITKMALSRIDRNIATASAGSAVAGLTLLLEGSPLPSLILLDLKMPGMNGIEALRMIRGDGRSEKIPVIIVTSSTLESDRTAAFAAGADAFLHKAFDIDEYERQIRSQLVRWLQD